MVDGLGILYDKKDLNIGIFTNGIITKGIKINQNSYY